MGQLLADLPVADIIVTKGAQGGDWIRKGEATLSVPAFRVVPVDTTGAGDCLIGSLAAAPRPGPVAGRCDALCLRRLGGSGDAARRL